MNNLKHKLENQLKLLSVPQLLEVSKFLFLKAPDLYIKFKKQYTGGKSDKKVLCYALFSLIIDICKNHHSVHHLPNKYCHYINFIDLYSIKQKVTKKIWYGFEMLVAPSFLSLDMMCASELRKKIKKNLKKAYISTIQTDFDDSCIYIGICVNKIKKGLSIQNQKDKLAMSKTIFFIIFPNEKVLFCTRKTLPPLIKNCIKTTLDVEDISAINLSGSDIDSLHMMKENINEHQDHLSDENLISEASISPLELIPVKNSHKNNDPILNCIHIESKSLKIKIKGKHVIKGLREVNLNVRDFPDYIENIISSGKNVYHVCQ